MDGVAVGVSESLTLNPSSLGNTVNNYIGKSQFGGDPCFNGSMDEFRIYNGALAANEIAQAYSLGPALVNPNLPPPWMTQDIGAVGVFGSANFTNGVFTMTGSGADIWNAADAFHFVYVPVTGNCIIVARVTSVQNIDPWSKAGVMIRESLATNAANAFIAVTPGNGVTWQTRSTTGGGTVNAATGGLNAPYWVKLVRNGNTFTGYRSPDGVTWTQQGTATFTMPSTAYVGLAVTSHNNSSVCAAAFDNVTASATSEAPPNLVISTDRHEFHVRLAGCVRRVHRCSQPRISRREIGRPSRRPRRRLSAPIINWSCPPPIRYSSCGYPNNPKHTRHEKTDCALNRLTRPGCKFRAGSDVHRGCRPPGRPGQPRVLRV